MTALEPTPAQEVAATGKRKVLVREGVRCIADGRAYIGEAATVPEQLATEWLRAGWATDPPAPEAKP